MKTVTKETKPYKYKDEDAERERRRKKYKLVLIRWVSWNGESTYEVEHKQDIVWKEQFMGTPKIICDWEPEKVLRGMLKLLKEQE